ncbi:type VI secretion system Vgr family protein [Gilliamella sp. Pas-s27]|uniref:type VI secretion system Vgr family protein n=1 Tax=Gilliamella sp. Pas-s27 TaxID=2687311 RepID=UPI001365E978|nr:type VI secretion system Vgr family protein [Gilliamella sp. Pas-s27]MWP46017.1 type VI secretion system tip protein VgrG [Gilliamella sp. Pas-s27]
MGIIEQLASHVDLLGKTKPLNRYSLSIDGLEVTTEISVLSLEGKEQLNQPWKYTINFTSQNKQILIDSVLSQKASLTFHPNSLPITLTQISSLDIEDKPRTLYGVITEFSFVSMSEDQAHYRVVLEPRLALLANYYQSAIFQNKSVIEVVEEILRNHDFIGIDFRIELNETYPAREFITQWQESDLAFIQRLLADVGIWFYFETHPKHHRDVIVISDYEQGLKKANNIVIKQPSGLNDSYRHSVWDLQFSCKTKPNQVSVNDYNYRIANNGLHMTDNSQPKDITTRGNEYRYEEHYKTEGDIRTVESGKWYARIRHQQHISEQLIIYGECNDYQLMPGQHIIIEECPIKDIKDGIIIISIHCQADRTQPYHTHFTAIPFNVIKPYRPEPLPWPQAIGTLPARVTSPDNDIYGYLDTQGRYRVKFNFDLKKWKNGEESLWIRFAKPYAGNNYGFHFPLIDGTEVAIAFMNGNPDRPYIAHAMHDSAHPDHVSLINKHRNVIRTPANNKLRMDDKRGQEHIKLATEYGKTQLNLGHLVDNKKSKRGEGFELRTDEWGVIRAGKGVYLTSYKREGNQGVKKASLDGGETAILLKTGLSVSNRLSKRSDSHRAGKLEGSDSFNLFVSYTATKIDDNLSFTQPSMVLSSPKGIAAVTPDSIYQFAEQNILLTSKHDTNIAANNSVHVSATKDYSVFAKENIKLFSGEAKVQLQAHNGDIEVIADKSLKIVSNDDKININAKKEITIACGGAYIRIADGNIELYAPGIIKHGAQAFPYSGPQKMLPTLYSFPKQQPQAPYVKQFILVEEGTGKPIINREYQIVNKDNQVIAEGKTDAQGKAQIVTSGYEEDNVIFKYK